MNGNNSPRSQRKAFGPVLKSWLVLVVAFACGELPGEVEQYDESAVDDMILFPAQAVIGVGRTLQLQTTFVNAQRRSVPGQVEAWESSDIRVAAVDDEGLVTAVSVGQTEITASAKKGGGKGRDKAPGQVKKKSKIIVSPDPVASVEVSPSSATLPRGGAIQFEAITRDADGNLLQGRFVTWSSSDDQVATADADGVVVGVDIGSAVITATSEGIQGTATVEVTGVLQVAIWPSGVDLQHGQKLQLYSAALLSDGQKVCDSSRASLDRTVLFNLTDYPAACDSAIARLNP